MTNVEKFNEVINDLAKVSIYTDNQLTNTYLGCIAEYLASIADSLNEIKKAKT